MERFNFTFSSSRGKKAEGSAFHIFKQRNGTKKAESATTVPTPLLGFSLHERRLPIIPSELGSSASNNVSTDISGSTDNNAERRHDFSILSALPKDPQLLRSRSDSQIHRKKVVPKNKAMNGSRSKLSFNAHKLFSEEDINEIESSFTEDKLVFPRLGDGGAGGDFGSGGGRLNSSDAASIFQRRVGIDPGRALSDFLSVSENKERFIEVYRNVADRSRDIFHYIESELGTLDKIMADPSLNRIAQEMIMKLSRRELEQFYKRHVSKDLVGYSKNTFGTYSVQALIRRAFEVSQDVFTDVIDIITGNVVELALNKNSVHIIGLLLTEIRERSISPVISAPLYESLLSNFWEIATSRHGCGVMKTLSVSLPWKSDNAWQNQFRRRVRANLNDLIQNPYGTYLVQFMFIQDINREMIVEEIVRNLAEASTQKYSSNAIEIIYKECDRRRKEIIANEFLSLNATGIPSKSIKFFLKNRYSNYVIQTILKSDISDGIIRLYYRYIEANWDEISKFVCSKNLYRILVDERGLGPLTTRKPQGGKSARPYTTPRRPMDFSGFFT